MFDSQEGKKFLVRVIKRLKKKNRDSTVNQILFSIQYRIRMLEICQLFTTMLIRQGY